MAEPIHIDDPAISVEIDAVVGDAVSRPPFLPKARNKVVVTIGLFEHQLSPTAAVRLGEALIEAGKTLAD